MRLYYTVFRGLSNTFIVFFLHYNVNTKTPLVKISNEEEENYLKVLRNNTNKAWMILTKPFTSRDATQFSFQLRNRI
jgi:ABC-type arginine transport system permease subunit